MKKIIKLSKQNIELSKAEVLALTKTKDYELYEDLLILGTKLDLKNRLGFSHSIYKLLFTCKKDNLIQEIDKQNWQEIYKENLCVRAHGGLDERYLADLIYDLIEYPIVNLTDPKTKVVFFKQKDIIICGLFLADVEKSYLERKAHLRPSLHPTSLHPALARACINLTGLNKGKILDPFCGSGGILIEAGLMGFEITGYDIDNRQLERSKLNLNYYKLKFKLEKKDSRNLKIKTDAIVTDLPYGKGSKGDNLEKLYEEFLLNIKNITKNIIVIFPDFIEYKKILEKTNWKIKKKFEVYVHKSLTKIILVL